MGGAPPATAGRGPRVSAVRCCGALLCALRPQSPHRAVVVVSTLSVSRCRRTRQWSGLRTNAAWLPLMSRWRPPASCGTMDATTAGGSRATKPSASNNWSGAEQPAVVPAASTTLPCLRVSAGVCTVLSPRSALACGWSCSRCRRRMATRRIPVVARSTSSGAAAAAGPAGARTHASVCACAPPPSPGPHVQRWHVDELT